MRSVSCVYLQDQWNAWHSAQKMAQSHPAVMMSSKSQVKIDISQIFFFFFTVNMLKMKFYRLTTDMCCLYLCILAVHLFELSFLKLNYFCRSICY